MARGKHSQRKKNADVRALREQLAALAAETAREVALGEKVRGQVAAARAEREVLAALVARRTQVTGPKVERVRQARDEARARLALAAAEHERVMGVWQRGLDRLLAHAPAGLTKTEQVEWMAHKIGLDHRLRSRHLPPGAHVSVDRELRLSAIRGERSVLADAGDLGDARDTPVRHAEGARPMLARAAAQAGVGGSAWAGLVARHAAAAASAASSTNRDAIALWQPAGWLDVDPVDPFEGLGYLGASSGEGTGSGRVRAHALLRAGALRAEASRDKEVLASAQALLAPWAALPRYSRTVDAMSLRHLYANSALGVWVRAGERPIPAGADPADDETWSDPHPSARVAAFAEVAYAMRTAVPFWLPPAQTHGFIDAEPAAHDTEEHLRLPFEAQSLFFGQPLLVPAVDGDAGGVDSDLHVALAFLSGDRGREQETFASFERPGAGAVPRTVSALIGAFGARVEGVLLLADAEGRRRDEFAWCLAVRGAGEGLVAARLCVPARVSELTAPLRAVVDNAAAVTAWGRWHSPLEDTELSPGAAFAGSATGQRRQVARMVHVLNVARTSGSGERGVPTGKSVSPHRRRGHWRRQRVGPGLVETRLVWMAPVLVNASRNVDVASAVYRLPVELAARLPAGVPGGQGR